MAAAFNAYHKWLGIPPEEQPPHHYRLLGIKPFEADPDVIESAADQRMAHLRTLSGGKNAELSQKLLNEISAAKVALLNPEKRAQYDQQLRRTMAAVSATISAGTTIAPQRVAVSPHVVMSDPAAGPDLAALPQINTRSSGRKRGISPAVLFAAVGGAIALVLIVGVLVAMNSGSGDGPDLAANTPTLNPPAPPGPPAAPSPAPPVPPQSPPAPPPTPVEPVAVSSPPDQIAWSDLMSGIALPRDAVRGTWTLEGGKLVTPKFGRNANALIKLATATPLPEAYDLKLVIERLDAAGYGVNVIVPIDGKQATVVMDGFRSIENGGGLWAIEQVDGRAGISNETKSPGGALAPGKQVEVLIEVRPERITATGGTQRTEFQGSGDRLTVHPIWKTDNQGLLLGVQGNFAFHRLEWRPAAIAETDTPAPTVAQRSVVTPLPAPLAQAAGVPIDLLAKIDAKRDAVSGPWVFEGMALLRRGSGDSAALQTPIPPPAEYDVKLVVERQGASGVGLGLVAGGKSFSLAFDGENQSFTGLMLDGQWAWKTNDPTVFRGAVAPRGKEATIIANVRKDRLRVQVNEELVLDWAADYRRCSSFPGWEPKDSNRLYLASNQSKFYVRKFELVPLVAGESVAANSPDAAPLPSPASTRPAPPDESQQTEIRKTLNELHKLTAKRTPAEKRLLAGELMHLAEGTRNKPAERYVFLRETQRLATEAGDFNLALQAVEGQADFEVDAMLESGRVLIAFASAAKDDFAYGKLVELVPEWVQRAMAEERVEPAEKLLEATLRAVQKPAGRKFAKPIIDLRTAVTAQAKQIRQLATAREKLAADPSDADANLVVGSVLCFHRGDWKAGLPLLVKGSDAALKACAERELTGAPKTADELIALGDAWWDASAKAPKEEQAGRTARAAHWYKLALGQSPAGLARIKIDRRLEEAAAAIAAQPVAGKLVALRKRSRVLIVMAKTDEQSVAQQACQKYGLDFDEAKSFDRKISDYSAYHTIMCGSNDMNYWGKEEANKDPAAFQHIERFVNQGGHLIVCGTFNGTNMEHLQRFGIQTGFLHSSTFERVGPATDLLFKGVEDLVPADNRMSSAGHFDCSRQHLVLLRRGPGQKVGGPALITRRQEKGRLTFTQCEPHWKGDMWLITVLLNWVSRGAPTP